MTIVQINVADYGSTGAIMQTVQKLAQCKGYSAKSFAGRCKYPEKDCEAVGGSADLYYHVLLARLGKNGHGSRRATEELVTKLKDIKPDAVILHNIHGYYIHLKTLFTALAELTDTHIYWVLHDCWSFTGGCAHFASANCRKWEVKKAPQDDCAENGCAENALTDCSAEKQSSDSHCGNCPIHSKLYPKSFIDSTEKEFSFKQELFTMLPSDRMTVIVPSDWIFSEVQKSFLSKYETVVIHNGVNVETFKPRTPEEQASILEKYGVPADKPIILGVASVWDDRKQPELFCKLAGVAKNCTVLMVGLSEKQLSKLPANVYGILRTENATELSCLYSAASVLLNPSLEDTFPLVPLEALACGTPVVTSPVCGCPEQISYETGIVLSKPTSVNEAYRAICTILDEKKRTASMSVKEADDVLYTTDLCRSRAVEMYDNFKMASAYMNLIEENCN